MTAYTEKEWMSWIEDQLTTLDNMYLDRTGDVICCAFSLHLSYGRASVIGYGSDHHDSLIFKGDTPSGAINAARAHIASMPSEEERNLRAFNDDVAALIDKGRKLRIADEYVNPLASIRAEISQMLLTDQNG